MRTPDLLTAFVDDSVLMWVDVVGESAGRCSPEMRKKLVFGVTRDDRKRELREDRSRRGG